MTLYEIDKSIESLIDYETGEIIDVDALDALQMERNAKIENVACWLKNLNAENAACETEIESFKSRIESNKRKIERLKGWLVNATGGQRTTLPKCDITFRKSQRVEIINDNDIPQAYRTPKLTITIDKARIKADILAGQTVSGAAVIDCTNVTVK